MDKATLSRKEAALYIGISLSKFATIQKEIPRVMLGGIVRYRKEDINEWLKTKLKEMCQQDDGLEIG